jgi:hypothetical protein
MQKSKDYLKYYQITKRPICHISEKIDIYLFDIFIITIIK